MVPKSISRILYNDFNDCIDEMGWASHNLLPIWKFHISRDDSNIATRKGQELPQAPTRASCCAHSDAHSHIFTLLLQTVFGTWPSFYHQTTHVVLLNSQLYFLGKAWLHLWNMVWFHVASFHKETAMSVRCILQEIWNILGTFTSLLLSNSEPKA